ncbi:type II toxin-antitoxin system YafQ family toxin [Azotobacter vinelandii]|uniref:type II toxin-antitoxin system YafQ family toxin n=1 Tax=Azotobacter vinelandii TaxID=354 RepID=UPI0000459FE5
MKLAFGSPLHICEAGGQPSQAFEQPAQVAEPVRVQRLASLRRDRQQVAEADRIRFALGDKRESKGRHGEELSTLLASILDLLVIDKPLPAKYRDHSLSGNWADHRDCHIKSDLVLLYRKPDDEALQLVRLGSHSELGL